MLVRECNSAKQLLLELHELQSTKRSGEWFFRGQRKSAWGLSPSLFRLGLDQDTLNSYEKRMIIRLRLALEERAIIFVGMSKDESTWPQVQDDTFFQQSRSLSREEQYLLALAQHYGARTRLLDWTRSPEVAAYFAASSAIREQQDCVEHFSIYAIASIYQNAQSMQGCTIVQPPMGGNDNMAAQRGVFLLHAWSVHDIWDKTNEVILQKSRDDNAEVSTRLIRFDVRTERAGEVLSEVQSRGVDGSNIFPGTRGLVEMAIDSTWQYHKPPLP